MSSFEKLASGQICVKSPGLQVALVQSRQVQQALCRNDTKRLCNASVGKTLQRPVDVCDSSRRSMESSKLEKSSKHSGPSMKARSTLDFVGELWGPCWSSKLKLQKTGSHERAEVHNARVDHCNFLSFVCEFHFAHRKEEEREAWVGPFESYFHEFSHPAWISSFGSTVEEVQHAWDKCRCETGLLRKDVLIGLHFVWAHPTQHQGAALWRMHRNTCKCKCWVPAIALWAHMKEMKMDNRKHDCIHTKGLASHVTLCVDATDAPIGKPASKADQRRFWTFENRKFAKRHVAAAASVATGDLGLAKHTPLPPVTSPSFVGKPGQAGSASTCRCRQDPKCIAPRRKPRNKPMAAADREHNTEHGGTRVIAENVFSRVKSWAVMTPWRHHRDLHDISAGLVFQLTQVKNIFRPVRAGVRNQPGTKRSWDVARATGSVPRAIPAAKSRAARRTLVLQKQPKRKKGRASSKHAVAQDAAMRAWEEKIYAMHACDARADRARQRALSKRA
eukprot:jgi/Bigna1/73733/fgenesh1_pg.25_\